MSVRLELPAHMNVLFYPVTNQCELGMEKCTALDVTNFFQSISDVSISTIFLETFFHTCLHSLLHNEIAFLFT